MTLNQDGNVIGRLGALAVVVFTLWGVQRINAGKFTITVEDAVTGKTGQVQGYVRAGERIDFR